MIFRIPPLEQDDHLSVHRAETHDEEGGSGFSRGSLTLCNIHTQIAMLSIRQNNTSNELQQSE